MQREVLPNEPFFVKLLALTHQLGDGHVAIHDPRCGIKATYPRFLDDVLATRAAIRQAVPPGLLDARGMVCEDRPYFILLAPWSYRYFVAFFAILALGGASVPLVLSVSADEAGRFLRKSKACCMVYAPDQDTRSRALELQSQLTVAAKEHSSSLVLIPIVSGAEGSSPPVLLRDLNVEIDQDLVVDPTRPSLVLGTSGSTGPPKGVVLTRNFLNVPMPDGGPEDLFATMVTALNWVGGVWPPTRLLLKGTRIEIFDCRPNTPETIWNRFRQGDITYTMIHSTMWTRMMKYYQEKIACLPEAERSEYIRGIRQTKRAIAGAVPTFPSVQRFWREILGRGLMNLYSAVELGGGGLRTDPDVKTDVERSAGTPYAQVEIKLFEGDHGEILVKGPSVFSHYLDNPEATAAVFEADGYYKTGDTAHIVDGVYIIDGRLKHDFIKHHAYKVPVPELEIQLLKLPYMDEVYAVAAPEAGVGEHIAALVGLKNESKDMCLTLQQLREDLLAVSSLPPGYRPTMLRILRDGDVIPRSRTEKPLRKQIAMDFFLGPDGIVPVGGHPLVEVWRSDGKVVAQDFDQGSERRTAAAA